MFFSDFDYPTPLFVVSQLRGGVRFMFLLRPYDYFMMSFGLLCGLGYINLAPTFLLTQTLSPFTSEVWFLFSLYLTCTHVFSVHLFTGRYNTDVVPVHVWVHLFTIGSMQHTAWYWSRCTGGGSWCTGGSCTSFLDFQWISMLRPPERGEWVGSSWDLRLKTIV